MDFEVNPPEHGGKVVIVVCRIIKFCSMCKFNRIVKYSKYIY